MLLGGCSDVSTAPTRNDESELVTETEAAAKAESTKSIYSSESKRRDTGAHRTLRAHTSTPCEERHFFFLSSVSASPAAFFSVEAQIELTEYRSRVKCLRNLVEVGKFLIGRIYHRQRRHIAPSVIPCVLCTPYRISRHDVRTSACRAPARHAAAHIAVYPVARSSAIVSVIHLRSNLSLSFRRLSKACAVFRAASPNRVRNARARSGFSFQSPSASIKYMPQIKMT